MNYKITQDELKRHLHYDPLTGIFIRKISNANCVKIGDIAGCLHSRGYIHIKINYIGHKAHRLAWLYVYGYFPEYDIHHINEIKHDNRICNLKHLTLSCHIKTRGLRKDNKSNVKGVVWSKNDNKWVSQINNNKKRIYLGIYKNLIDAAKARWNAEVKYNFPNCQTTSSAYLYIQKYKADGDCESK